MLRGTKVMPRLSWADQGAIAALIRHLPRRRPGHGPQDAPSWLTTRRAYVAGRPAKASPSRYAVQAGQAHATGRVPARQKRRGFQRGSSGP